MNINNAFRHFLENEAASEYQNSLLALDKYFHDNFRQLVEECTGAFTLYFKHVRKAQEQGRKKKAAYIFASFLYTALQQGKGLYRLDTYDQDWFFDLTECAGEYDALWAYGFLHELCAKLQDKSKRYVGKITRYDIELLKRMEAGKFSVYVDTAMRQAVKAAVKTPEFAAMDKEDVLELFIGEYKDQCRMLYRYDRREKDMAVLSKEISEKITTDFAFAVWEGLTFDKLHFGETDLRYARFTGSTLSSLVFDQALFWGVNAANTKITGSQFINIDLPEADFSRSIITNSTFSGIDGELCGLQREPYIGNMLPASFYQAVLVQTEFQESILNEVSFMESQLTKCHFNRVELKKANFHGAKLEQCIFNDCDLSQADFTGASFINCDFATSHAVGAVFSAGTDLTKLGLSGSSQVILR